MDEKQESAQNETNHSSPSFRGGDRGGRGMFKVIYIIKAAAHCNVEINFFMNSLKINELNTFFFYKYKYSF